MIIDTDDLSIIKASSKKSEKFEFGFTWNSLYTIYSQGCNGRGRNSNNTSRWLWNEDSTSNCDFIKRQNIYRPDYLFLVEQRDREKREGERCDNNANCNGDNSSYDTTIVTHNIDGSTTTKKQW